MPGEDDLVIRVGLTEKQYLQSVARIEASTVRAAGRIERRVNVANRGVVRSYSRANDSANRFAKGGLRNIGLQLAQVTQVGGMTGNWVQALAVQLPDMALGFGLAGVAAGTLLGALAPLIANMIGTDDAGKKLGETFKRLAASMQDLEAARRRAGTSLSELRGEYGNLGDEAQRLFEIQRRIAELNAQKAFSEAFAGAGSALGLGGILGIDPAALRNAETVIASLETSIVRLREKAASPETNASVATAAENAADALADQVVALIGAGDAVADFADRLGISADSAHDLVVAFAEVTAATGPRDQAEAISHLADMIYRATDGLAAADDETRALYERLLDANAAALNLAAVDMASPIGAAADAAALLARNLAAARSIKVYSGRGGDPRDFMEGGKAADYEHRLDYVSVDQMIARYTPRSGGGGARPRSGGGSAGVNRELNRLMAERDRIRRDLETASEKYARELADLNRLQQMGELSADQYSAALKKLNEDLVNAKFGDVIRNIGDIATALANAAVNGENMGDAVVGALRSIVAEAIAADIRTAALSLFGTGTSGTGGLLSALLGALPGRAAGGPVQAGQPYQVGEHGPELFIPTSDGQIVNSAVTRDILRSRDAAAGPPQFYAGELFVTDDGSIAARISYASAAARHAAVADVRQGFGAMQAAQARDGRMV